MHAHRNSDELFDITLPLVYHRSQIIDVPAAGEQAPTPAQVRQLGVPHVSHSFEESVTINQIILESAELRASAAGECNIPTRKETSRGCSLPNRNAKALQQLPYPPLPILPKAELLIRTHHLARCVRFSSKPRSLPIIVTEAPSLHVGLQDLYKRGDVFLGRERDTS